MVIVGIQDSLSVGISWVVGNRVPMVAPIQVERNLKTFSQDS